MFCHKTILFVFFALYFSALIHTGTHLALLAPAGGLRALAAVLRGPGFCYNEAEDEAWGGRACRRRT